MESFTAIKMIMILKISSVAPEWNEIIDLRRDARDKELEYWLSESLFTFNWWFLLVTTILFLPYGFISWIKKEFWKYQRLGRLLERLPIFSTLLAATWCFGHIQTVFFR